MTTIPQSILDDIKTQIYQYVYRSTEMPFDALLSYIQEISGNGNLNWHLDANKAHLIAINLAMNTAITNYTLEMGDFRAYMHLSFVNTLTEEYLGALYQLYMQKSYNVPVESIISSLSDAYTTAPPQNSNFPGLTNTSQDFLPAKPATKLVPKSLYSDNVD